MGDWPLSSFERLRERSERLRPVALSAGIPAAAPIEEDTVDLQKGEVDPEATAVMEPVTAPSTPRPSFVQRLWSSIRRKEG